MSNSSRVTGWLLAAVASLSIFLVENPSRAGTLAQFRTVHGDLEVELYDQDKPITTGNFKRLTEAGAYQNTFFHRLAPNFVAQGGGFFSASKGITNPFAPPWTYVGSVPNFGPITNEFGVGPFLSNTNGTIAMAKVGSDPNSATSQWFFNLGDNSSNLDNQNGGFTVFGRVVRDTGPTNTGGLLGLFNSASPWNYWVNMGWWYPSDSIATGLFGELPVTYSGVFHPRYADLFYVDVTLLSVQIALTNSLRQVSWNSVSGLPNVVEYTTTMPPAWSTLVSTNGTGSRMAVVDPTATNQFRFYRVRVLY